MRYGEREQFLQSVFLVIGFEWQGTVYKDALQYICGAMVFPGSMN